MTEPKKNNPLLMAAIVVGVLGLCCVGSCGVAVLVGAVNPVVTSTGGGAGLEGRWSQGSTSSFTEYRNAAGSFAPPSGTGAFFEFKPGGDCEHFALFQTTLYSCTQSIFIAHDECDWEFDGTRLTVRYGEGDTITRACGGELKRSTAEPSTVTFNVALTGDELVLSGEGTTLTLRRER